MAADLPSPPVAPVKPVTDDYFGQKVTDPYRYMENLSDPEVQSWMKAQADTTAATLDRIPGREKLLARIHELMTARQTRVTNVHVRPGGVLFYEKVLATENTPKLYMRKGTAASEKLLLDPAKLNSTGGQPHAISYYSPSWDGGWVVVGVSEGGSEQAVIHIVNTATGAEAAETIDRTWFGIIGWKDATSFYYNRLQEMRPGMGPADKELKSVMWLHKIGESLESDRAVFGFDRSAAVNFDPIDLPIVDTDPSSATVVGVVARGVQNEARFYSAPLASVDGAASTPWKKIADLGDDVTNEALHGDNVYLLTHKNAPRFRILRTSLSHPDIADAQVFVPQGSGVITDMAAAQDALYIRVMDGGVGHLRRVPYEGGAPEEIKLPFEGDFAFAAADTRVTGVLISLMSWVKAARILSYSPVTKRLTDTQLQPLGPNDDRQDITSEEVKIPSYDGTLVPVSIIHKKGLPLDGTSPTLLSGYGAYGTSRTPVFNSYLLAWLETGGIYAVAHVRGGGEYGQDWYQGGYKLTKPNTWRDFIASAEYLIRQKYTSAAKLGIEGGSAGGILVGRSLTERSDLFAAVIDRVGVSDTLRVEFSPNGPVNIPEFGSVKTEEGFEDLYAMSSYAHVADRTPYPAVMLTTGINDPRVDPWQSGKMTARLQAATSSTKPILLRVDYQAGHGYGSTRDQIEKLWADVYSFLFWQMGEPDFQPSGSK
ncbi:MAG TPA: prolyl oligopeptidase family serine peptidase [Bryobacteraceae bacterium]|nr:prolyl oligopeptidase family serine peptidase [Bryobacteraceae bacterium]